MSEQVCTCGQDPDPDVCACSIRDGDCIHMAGSGSVLNPYRPEAALDTDEDNLMTEEADGLLVELPAWIRNPDRCQVYHSANQATVHNSSLSVEFNSERFDSTGDMHNNVTLNERVFIRTSGVYICTFVCAFAQNGTGGRQAFIRKNGKEFIAGVHRGAVADSETGLIVTTEEWLNAGDLLTCVVKQTSGGALNLIGNTRYSPIFTVIMRRPEPE